MAFLGLWDLNFGYWVFGCFGDLTIQNTFVAVVFLFIFTKFCNVFYKNSSFSNLVIFRPFSRSFVYFRVCGQTMLFASNKAFLCFIDLTLIILQKKDRNW